MASSRFTSRPFLHGLLILLTSALGSAVAPADPDPGAGLALDGCLQLAAKETLLAEPFTPADPTLDIGDGSGAFPRWRFRTEYFQGTDNDIGNVLTGDSDLIAQNGFAFGAGYVLASGFGGMPLDLIVQGTVMWHDEKGWQDNFLQYTASLRAEWTSFPWNAHLRTRMALASGWSYAEKIPYAEVLNRDSLTSQHFLHYLEPSISLNTGDLFRLTRLHHVFSGIDSHSLDQTWLVARVLHRSGAWGLYGKDADGQDVSTASNFLSIGLEFDF